MNHREAKRTTAIATRAGGSSDQLQQSFVEALRDAGADLAAEIGRRVRD